LEVLAYLGCDYFGVIVRAESELEETSMIGGQFDFDDDLSSRLVVPDYDTLAVRAPRFVRPRLKEKIFRKHSQLHLMLRV